MKKILVIGNGFDLAHGLKTGYRDFVARVEEAFAKEPASRDEVDKKLTTLCNVNGFFRHFHFSEALDGSWAFFEEEMGSIVRALARFMDVMEEKRRDPEFELQEYNLIAGLYTYEELRIFQHFARIFEQVIDDPTGGIYKLRVAYATAERTLNRQAYLDEVRRELEDFTAALDLYLAACVGTPEDAVPAGEDRTDDDGQAVGRMPVDRAREASLLKDLPDYVINFNFTDTVTRYGVPEERIYFAKGRAGSDPVNLVLGCPERRPHGPRRPAPGTPPLPGMPPMLPPPGSPHVPCGHEEWLPFGCDFQKLSKEIGLPDRNQLHPADGERVTVGYFGYSFPEGDAPFLTDLIDAAAQSHVFCTDREDYARKLLALMRLIGKERVTDLIYGEQLLFEILE